VSSPAEHHHTHEVSVSIDGRTVHSPRHTTAGDLLRAAGLDPARRRLVKVEGRHQTPFDPADELTLHDGETFVTVATGPTPVS
jgi:hypothetical protein